MNDFDRLPYAYETLLMSLYDYDGTGDLTPPNMDDMDGWIYERFVSLEKRGFVRRAKAIDMRMTREVTEMKMYNTFELTYEGKRYGEITKHYLPV